MPNENAEYLNRVSEYWNANRPIEAGRLIFENLEKEDRVNWAANILKAVVERTKLMPPPVERILWMADHSTEWKNAHDAFSDARSFNIGLVDLNSRSAEQEILLGHVILAEVVAKLIYNATGPNDEFDEDNGWYIASSLKELLDLLGDDEFSRAMFLKLCER